ncbi:MAG: hypothetical protein J6Q73_07790 [Bacteroidaceae bacterium]|nr:hypothetical protein [Bacteroidaceae bacterium]
MERILKKLYLLAGIAMLAVGCTTTKYVPVESVRVDSVYVARVERDSIYERDSVFVAVKADTVFVSKVQYRYRDRIVRDTLSVLQRDTITRVVEVEKRLSRREQLKMDVGGGVLWALPIIIGLFILYRRLKK